jgi:pilus assembly protein FimV
VGNAIIAAILAAGLALAAPFAAQAAGLGKLTVLSPLGQPLNAEIEIVALRPGEEETLTARIAGVDAFAAAGIEPSAVLNSMRFAIERRGNQRILRVTTLQAVNEPFVEFLVELQWNTGRLVREYTFLLDPPEYKARDVAAAPKPAPVEAKPAAPAEPPKLAEPPQPPAAESTPAVEARPVEPAAPPPLVAAAPTPPAPAAEPAKEEPAKPEPVKEPAAQEEPAKEAPAPQELAKEPDGADKVHEVVKGETLANIAKANLPPGVTLNQMLVAIYRANEDAFIRGNVNWVRAGRILSIPPAESIGTVDVGEANRVVRAHMAEFREYRSKLAAAPASADAASAPRESGGVIEPKPAAPTPAAPQDQVRLSKVDPQKPAAPGAAAARGDDLVARERALQEAQSRISDLEKNVADLQKMLEIRNQQLAELQRKAAEKPPAPPAPAAPAPATKAPEKPAPAPTPAPSPAPAPVAKAPEAPKPAAKPAAAQPALEPSLLDEFLDNPVALAGLAGVAVLLVFYALWAWRKKKATQARFQDSVMDAAAAGAASGAAMTEPTLAAPSTSTRGSTQPAAPPPAAAAAEEVDPIAEADVYMAYGRDAQAEEILKEALQKDPNRIAVHSKLLEIYAKRHDTTAFEQTAAKLKGLTGGAGPDWEKAAALGKSIDPNNGLYAGATLAAAAFAAPVAASAPSAPSPALDFDIGGATHGPGSLPDLQLDAGSKPGVDSGLDFDLSGAGEKKPAPAVDSGLDFNLDLGAAPSAPSGPERKPEPATATTTADPGLTFDIDLDLGEKSGAKAAAPDLSTISLDLGSGGRRPRRRAPTRSGRRSRPSSTSPRPTRKWATRTARASCSAR